MLSVVGKESTEFAISYNYIGKELFGQIGGLWYMYRMGKHADTSPVKFTNRAMIAQQIAIGLECATPLLPSSLFLPVASAATIGTNISMTGMGVINTKVIQKMGGKNIGELYAKITTINTIASTIGMGLGLLIIAKVPDHTVRLGIIPFITGMRIYTFRKSLLGLF